MLNIDFSCAPIDSAGEAGFGSQFMSDFTRLADTSAASNDFNLEDERQARLSQPLAPATRCRRPA